MTTLHTLAEINLGAPVRLVRSSPKGQTIVALLKTGELCLLDGEKLQLRATIQGGDEQRFIEVAFRPDGQEIVAAEGRGRLSIYDATTGHQQGEFDANTSSNFPRYALSSITRDETLIVYSEGEKRFERYSWKTRRLLGYAESQTMCVGGLVPYPTEDLYLELSSDSDLETSTSFVSWPETDGDSPAVLSALGVACIGSTTKVVFSPNGELLCFGAWRMRSSLKSTELFMLTQVHHLPSGKVLHAHEEHMIEAECFGGLYNHMWDGVDALDGAVVQATSTSKLRVITLEPTVEATMVASPHTRPIQSVHVIRKTGRLVTGGADGRCCILALELPVQRVIPLIPGDAMLDEIRKIHGSYSRESGLSWVFPSELLLED